MIRHGEHHIVYQKNISCKVSNSKTMYNLRFRTRKVHNKIINKKNKLGFLIFLILYSEGTTRLELKI